MNAKSILAIAAGAVVVLFTLDFLTRKAGGDIRDAISDANKDTPFEGFGPVGTLGNVTDTILFGVPSTFGSWLGLQGSKAINFINTGEFR